MAAMSGLDWTASVDPRDPTPLHAQLERSIRAAIASHRLRPGDQLPTVRQLAVALRINANTVAKVYTHLERDGALGTRRGVGTFVLDAPALATDHQEAREAELRAVVARAIADASARGFSVADLRRALLSIAKGETS
jgi:GntR family transcriptional regulator